MAVSRRGFLGALAGMPIAAKATGYTIEQGPMLVQLPPVSHNRSFTIVNDRTTPLTIVATGYEVLLRAPAPK